MVARRQCLVPFGTTSANATCVPITNTWNIDTGNGPEDLTSFEQLWGTCMVTEPCNCTAIAINSTNMQNYVDPLNPFYSILTSSAVRPARFTTSGCSGTMSCPDDYALLVFDSTGLGKTGFNEETANGKCDLKTQKWKVDTGSRVRLTMFKEMFGVCVPNASPNTMSSTTSTIITTATPLNNNSCIPATPSTFLFAYSNDLDMNATHKSWQLFANYQGGYSTFGRVRFDVKVAEPIEYYTNFQNYQDSIYGNLPNPSKSYGDAATGSDILKVLEDFVDNENVEVCGAQIVVYLKRYPNEQNVTRLAEKMRAKNIYMYVSVSTTPSGGSHQTTLYELTTMTYGLCYFETGANTPPAPIFMHTKPYLHYANNRRTAGIDIQLKGFNLEKKANYTYVMTIQDNGPLIEGFLRFQIWTPWVDGVAYTITRSDVLRTEYGTTTYFADKMPLNEGYSEIGMSIYLTSTYTIQCRLYSEFPPDYFIPYGIDIEYYYWI